MFTPTPEITPAFMVTGVSDDAKAALRGKRCIFPISIPVDGSRCCLGDTEEEQSAKIRATFQFLKEADISSVTFVLVDTLQRYTMRNRSATPEDTKQDEKALVLIRQSSEYFRKLVSTIIGTEELEGTTIVLNIRNWDDYVEKRRSEFQKKLALIKARRGSDPEYEAVLTCTAASFMSNVEHNPHCSDANFLFIGKNNIAYLEEECAQLLQLLEEGDYIIYPLNATSAIAKTMEIFDPDRRCKYIKINHKMKKPSDIPQPSTNATASSGPPSKNSSRKKKKDKHKKDTPEMTQPETSPVLLPPANPLDSKSTPQPSRTGSGESQLSSQSLGQPSGIAHTFARQLQEIIMQQQEALVECDTQTPQAIEDALARIQLSLRQLKELQQNISQREEQQLCLGDTDQYHDTFPQQPIVLRRRASSPSSFFHHPKAASWDGHNYPLSATASSSIPRQQPT